MQIKYLSTNNILPIGIKERRGLRFLTGMLDHFNEFLLEYLQEQR